jgi:hypothetical protein
MIRMKGCLPAPQARHSDFQRRAAIRRTLHCCFTTCIVHMNCGEVGPKRGAHSMQGSPATIRRLSIKSSPPTCSHLSACCRHHAPLHNSLFYSPAAALSMRSTPQPQRSPRAAPGGGPGAGGGLRGHAGRARARPAAQRHLAGRARAPARAGPRATRAASGGAAAALPPAALALQVLDRSPGHAWTRLSPVRHCVRACHPPWLLPIQPSAALTLLAQQMCRVTRPVYRSQGFGDMLSCVPGVYAMGRMLPCCCGMRGWHDP